MAPPLRVLFVSHDAYKAGATIFLLNMLRWMRANTDLRFDVALRDDGELVAEFDRVARAFLLLPPGKPSDWRDILRRAWGRWKPGRRKRSLRSVVAAGAYDLVYLNTLTLGDQLADLDGIALPVITHAHELGYVLRLNGRGEVRRMLQRSARVLCVSDAVQQNLHRQFADLRPATQRIHGCVPVDVRPEGSEEERKARLLDPLGIPRGALLVGACSHGTLVKGADLAVPLMRLLPPAIAGREVHLVWVGSMRTDYPRDMMLLDAEKAGLSGRIHFPGSTGVPADWMSLFDVQLLLSREDSFPLVVMEAAALGVPTVAFQGSGGAAEFIGTDAGVCAPYLDLPAMAAGLVELLADESRRRELGRVARQRVVARHAPDTIFPQILSAMEEVAGGRAAAPDRAAQG